MLGFGCAGSDSEWWCIFGIVLGGSGSYRRRGGLYDVEGCAQWGKGVMRRWLGFWLWRNHGLGYRVARFPSYARYLGCADSELCNLQEEGAVLVNIQYTDMSLTKASVWLASQESPLEAHPAGSSRMSHFILVLGFGSDYIFKQANLWNLL